ncbi:MAG: chorismate pyruvate-lyase family protein [Pseudomonadales bacterium]
MPPSFFVDHWLDDDPVSCGYQVGLCAGRLQHSRAPSITEKPVMPEGLHPPLDFILDDTNWLDYRQFQTSSEFRQHCEALSLRGLFTGYLGRLELGEVGVELVQQDVIVEMPETNRRDVRIRAGSSLAAIASTLISEQVLQSESWLNTLGNRPIGEMLESKLGAQRADIRYAAIESDSALFENFPNEPALWGRRYLYKFDSGELSITEIIADSIVARLFQSAVRP